MAVSRFGHQISWSQFQKYKARPSGVNYDGETFAGYNAKDIQFARRGNAIVVKSATVEISMDSRQSWVVIGKTDASLLKHEQGHYDIAALAARDFYRGLFNLSEANEMDLQTKINNLNIDLQKKINDTNDRYDLQTNHSQIKTIQDQWNRAIAAEKVKKDGSIDNLP